MRFARSRAPRKLILGLLLLTLGACTSTPEAKSARFIEDGKKFLAKKDMSRAILAFRNAAKAMPKDAEAYYELSEAYLAAGDSRNGVLSLRKALELNPKHKAAQLQLAELMAATNDQDVLKDAQDRLRALLQDGANDPQALHTLALTEFKLGDQEGGMHHLDMAIAAAPQDMMIAVSLVRAKLAKKDTKGAEAVLLQVCQQSPKSVDAVIILGQFYRAVARTADAEQQFQRAAAMDPANGSALLNLALLQDQLGKKPEAEQTLKRLSLLNTTFNHSYGVFLLREGRNDEAVREFERLAKANRDDRAARTRLVAVYQRLNRPGDAERVLNQALKKNSKDSEALLQRGEMFLAARKYDQAEADLNKVLQMHQDSPEAHYVLGKISQARGANPRYEQEMAKALELNPYLLPVRLEYSQMVMAANPQAALDILSGAPKSQQGSLGVLENRNWALWALGNMSEMRKGIDQGLALSRSEDLLIQDGFWKLKSGDAKGARSVLEQALKIDPADLRALRALSGTFKAEKNSKAAIQYARDYASVHPQSAPIQDFLGTLLMVSNDPADRIQARKAFMAAKAADPHFAKADLSLTQLDVMDGKVADARKRLEDVVASNNGNATAHLWLGNLAEMQGDHKAAIEQFRKVVAANENNAQASNNLAYLLTEYGNSPDEALKNAQRAVELAPDRPAYCDTLGWALYQKGLYSSAIPYLEKANASPHEAVWKYHLAMAYFRAGDFKKGRTILDAALKMNANLPEAKQAQQVIAESH